MTIDEAKTVFLNRGYVEVEGGTIYDADKWRESCRVISEWLEQEPIITSTEDSAEMTYPQVKGITPTVVEPIPDVDKKIESYKKLLKHPVIKHVMDMDETPVTLSVSENPNNCDLISREAVCDYIAEFINHEYSTQSECEMVDSMIDGIQHMQSVKPQTGHWIMQHRKVNTINYRTGEDVLTGEIHTVKELIRYECDEPYCSECGKRAGDTSGNYCCFCGARMESEQNG